MGKNINVESFDEMAKASKKLQEISDSYTSISKQLMQEASTMGTAWKVPTISLLSIKSPALPKNCRQWPQRFRMQARSSNNSV